MLLPIGSNTRNQTHQEGITPWTATCSDWVAESVTAKETDQGIDVRIAGRYQEAEGTFRICLNGNGVMDVAYHFVSRKKIEARQVGIVFDFPNRCGRLEWERNARWTVYPQDHIGRPVGTTTCTRESRWPPVAPGERPSWPWAYDESPMGTNDFRATRTAIRHLSLTDETGCGLEMTSDGTQAARAWLAGERVHLLLADFSRGTGEKFLHAKGFTAATPLNLKPGQVVQGIIHTSLTQGCQ